MRPALASLGVLVATAVALLLPAPSGAQIVRPPFAADYHLYDLGSVPGVPLFYGGIAFLSGDPDRLLIAGVANAAGGSLYSIGVVRGAGNHIVGFSGVAAVFSDAPFIDGGLAYHPGGVLFLSRYHPELDMAELGELKPGSTTTDKVVNLSASPLAVHNAPGGLSFVPAGMPGAGVLKLASFGDGQWYSLDLAPDMSDTFDVTGSTPTVVVGACPEGFVYRPAGTAGFANHSLVLAEWCASVVRAYEVDASGDPVATSGQVFVDGIPGPEGIAVDPTTGDILISQFGEPNRIYNVHAYAPLPCTSDADCNDSNVCTDDACDMMSGNCTYTNHDAIACDDGLYCDGADTCQDGYCSVHAGNPCAMLPNCQDFCIEGADSCGNTPAGSACTTPGGFECRQDVCDGAGTCDHPPQPANTPCTPDGTLCTTDFCDSGGSCRHQAIVDGPCRQPFTSGKATILIKNEADPKKDLIDWKWVNGSATDLAAFGDPVTATDYELCIFDAALHNGTKVFYGPIPHAGTCAGKPCWKAKGKPPRVKGYKYNDKNLTQQGIQIVDLTAGADKKAKVTAKGKGANLDLPPLPLSGDVVVQLRSSTGECWGARYSTPKKNTDKQYKANAD
ncbi:MAG TPA: hypothetical protein VFD92_10120 [Candidatus Binatia bacterium]|nr:hypothetical protein [Candidatus Binatia bacterium]